MFWVKIFKLLSVIKLDANTDLHDSGLHKKDDPADMLSILIAKLLLLVESNFVLEMQVT